MPMEGMPKAESASDAPAWHAMGAQEVTKRLTTDTEKGLNASEATGRPQKYGPNRLPEGRKRGPLMRFLSQFNNVPVYFLLGAGFVKLMLNPLDRCCDHSGRRHHQRVARLHPGGAGGEGARVDPQHVVCRGAHLARRRDTRDCG